MDERKKFGAGNKAEQMPQEVATAEKALESFSRKAAEILVSHGVQGTVEEIKKYIEEDYDPEVFEYLNLIMEVFVYNPKNVFLDEEIDLDLQDAYVDGALEATVTTEASTLKVYRDINLRYHLAHLRSLALLNQAIYKTDVQEEFRKFFKKGLMIVIEAYEIAVKKGLRFQSGLMPSHSQSEKINGEKTFQGPEITEEVLHGSAEDIARESIESGMDPRLARRRAEVNTSRIMDMLKERRTITAPKLQKELERFFEKRMNLNQLADMVLGQAENFKKEWKP